MATTRLSDIIDTTVFQDLPQVEGPEKTAFFDSQIVSRSPLLDGIASQPGQITELPFWKDLDGSVEVYYSNDDPNTSASPQKVTQGKQVARKAFVNQGWSSADLASEIAMGGTAMEAVRARTDRYFAKQFQRRLIASVEGIYANNVANNSSDMVEDVSVDDGGNIAAGTRFNKDAFIEAAYTMGDQVDGVQAIAAHSAVAKVITKLNDAEDVRDSDGQLLYRAYMGRRIIVDDTLPAEAVGTGSGFKYISVLFGSDAFGFGNGNPETPVEIDRKPDAANGGGIEELWLRNTWLLHPFGYKQEGTPSGQSFSLSELRTDAVWARELERKLVPIAFLRTN